jgi:hypothetical protein
VFSGKVYAVLRAEDGNRLSDRRLRQSNVKALADRVDAGGGTPEEQKLRRHNILTFYVNKAPRLLVNSPGFVPAQPWPASFPGRQLRLVLNATDEDPVDPASRPGVGGPSNNVVLRWTVRVKGKDAQGRDLVYTPPGMPSFQPQITIDLPPEMVSTSDTLKIQLCDCEACELRSGQGRCVDYDIPITVPPPLSPASSTSVEALPRPGEPNVGKRSNTP